MDESILRELIKQELIESFVQSEEFAIECNRILKEALNNLCIDVTAKPAQMDESEQRKLADNIVFDLVVNKQ